ncbi:MAG: hypothetical protein GX921_10270 [Bacteroidales bacterium]|nr:hypothetical protein [Bacteroidales bacterium]
MFYIALGVQAAFLVSLAFQWISISSDSTTISIALERYTLLITLLGIPGALKLFSLIMNKNPKDNNPITVLYKKAFTARFSILFLIASLNIVLYGISLNQNFMLLTLITFTAYIFSYPSKSHLKTTQEDKEPEQD